MRAVFDLIDSSLESEFWWGYWRMVRMVAEVLREALVWAENCCCQYEFLYTSDGVEMSKEIRQSASGCLLRGLMLRVGHLRFLRDCGQLVHKETSNLGSRVAMGIE